MSQQYSVQTDLSFAEFDEPKSALALVREVMAEVGRLERLDRRLCRSRMRVRRRDKLVEIVLVVTAGSWTEAYDIGMATLRSSLHAAGGSSASWSRVRPQFARSHPQRHETSWSAAADAAGRRARFEHPLPAMTSMPTRLAIPTADPRWN